MKSTILSRLNEIEQTHHIVILYACESGSRAWGFPSADSDYDVRFLYLRPVHWYLSVEEKRDVIEVPIDDQLDITGWDLKKALQLFRKSNPPLLEWLGSPVVYVEKHSVRSQLRELAKEHFSPQTCFLHYFGTARNHYREATAGEGVKLKSYFYALRTLLATLWIEAGNGVAPTEFRALLERMVTDSALKAEILSLLARKQAGAEKDSNPRIPLISDFIEAEIARLETSPLQLESRAAPYEILDGLFQKTLAEVWK
ncbi:MAG: DNA polymerase beta superfamily protein [Chloroflexota bacterium]